MTPENANSEKSVLIIDDEPDMRFALARIISRIGYATHEACTIDEAQNCLLTQDIDIAFCDVRIPNESDSELFIQRATNAHPQLKIIMMSCMMEREDEARLKGLGAVACLRKPFFSDKCSEIIEQFTQYPLKAA